MASIVNGFAIEGVEGYLVDVETKTISGQPSISVVGLGDTAVKEARERVESALTDGGYDFPQMKVVINLAPGNVKKSGSHFDLPVALGLLMETNQLKGEKVHQFGYIGELSLNARIRPCAGVLPMVMAAKQAGIEKLIVPAENLREALLVKGVEVLGFTTLQEVVAFLEDRKEYQGVQKDTENLKPPGAHQLDFAEVQGQEAMIEYIVASAAGGHNLLMIGTPGCGKSMIAKRIPTILPRLTEEEALEVTKVYSVAGLLEGRGKLMNQRPFRAPHHNASTNSLIGGGNNATPGEISLAHNGVLFLDEIPEFSKKTLEALRQPMEDRVVTVSRVKHTNTYPASFMLIGAMNPCPCGYFGTEKCRCSDYEVVKYRQKLSGPILDRMDIQKYVQPVSFMEMTGNPSGKSSQELRERVEMARTIQQQRFEAVEGINCNAQMGHSLIKEHCQLEPEGKKMLQQTYERYKYSARTFHKFLKVARTFADLDTSPSIRKCDVAAALMARDLEKDGATMVVV